MTEAPHAPDQTGDHDLPFWTAARRRHLAWALLVVLVLILLAVLPPLISINRYQKRVATAISGSLGRPVHFDNLSMHLLPLPGITIQNFVVGEKADFGAEPVMRANIVQARLRVSSLWRRRIEVSSIDLENPSINLVRRRSDGAWNLQSILMQASQMNSAPTAQSRAGDAPRFPYIEATEARINIKSDDDKLPFSVRDADLALWLPEPNEWHLRLSGKPVRTDTDVSDVGLIRVDATLGRAADLSAAPIDLTASWKPTPLGEAGKLTVGYDTGWRGEASAEATLKGSLGKARLTADLHLLALRRADFVPANTAELNAHCEGTTGGLLRSVSDLRCAIPTRSEGMFAAIDFLRKAPTFSRDEPAAEQGIAKQTIPAKPGVLLVQANIPNVLDWRSISAEATLSDADPNYALAWLRLFSKRTPQDLSVGGKLALNASRTAASSEDGGHPATWNFALTCGCDLPARTRANPAEHWLITVNHISLPNQQQDGIFALNAARWPEFPKQTPATQNAPATAGTATAANPSSTKGAPSTATQTAQNALAESSTTPVSAAAALIPPAAETPAIAPANTITGQISRTGYTLIYGSRSAADTAAAILPPLGDDKPKKPGTASDGTTEQAPPTNAPQPTSTPGPAMQADRTWYGKQTWTVAAAPPAPKAKAPLRRKR